MAEIREIFRPLNVEIVGEPSNDTGMVSREADIEEMVMTTLLRRPSTLDDLEKTVRFPHVFVPRSMLPSCCQQASGRYVSSGSNRSSRTVVG
jgi:hypothetical protein